MLLKTELEIQFAVNAILNQKVILYPTDTIWGLGGHGLSEEVYERIYEIKQRPKTKSFILLVNSIDMLRAYVTHIHPRIENLLEVYEKPLTIIYPNHQNLPKNIFDKPTVAIRICSDPFCNEIIKRIGVPLISTSANLSGEASPSNYADISDMIKNNVDHIVNYRQTDKTKKTSSDIVKYDDDGVLEFLR